MHITEQFLKQGTWQAFERAICRLLVYQGYEGIRLVGRAGDKGADIIAHKYGKRFIFQAKHWKRKVGIDVLDDTIKAMSYYKANIATIVALNGFDSITQTHQRTLLNRGIHVNLWTSTQLERMFNSLPMETMCPVTLKGYQSDAVNEILHAFLHESDRRVLVVMATGLGKTITAWESIRRMTAIRPLKILVLAHTNELVYQLERSLWRFIAPFQRTIIWNGNERPLQTELESATYVFACVNTVAQNLMQGGQLPDFDVILVDECHHVGGDMYTSVLTRTNAGRRGGPFLIGLTATPWRPDEHDIQDWFGSPRVCIDMITGLKNGFLSNVEYKMYTDNINWPALLQVHGEKFSPKRINRTLFITQWDDAVVQELRKVWSEQPSPRAIVFCGTIDHAILMRDRINSLGFCHAASIYSQMADGQNMTAYERNCTLLNFHDGTIDVICAVDIFNEGVDVPDVNIIVFQRVTHSRRIFIQQLGRGLRLSPGKDKVVVLDFVSDIRRFAAGLTLQHELARSDQREDGKPIHVSLPHKVSFHKVGGEDPESESFLRMWLDDVASLEEAGEDDSVLRYPPTIPKCKL